LQAAAPWQDINTEPSTTHTNTHAHLRPKKKNESLLLSSVVLWQRIYSRRWHLRTDLVSEELLSPINKLRHQAQRNRFGYKAVVFKGDTKKLNLHGTCAVCLEDFRVKDELGVLPCQHAFHRRCLVKWLEVRCVCPMCNKHIAGPPEQRHSLGTLLDELV
uniref:RING-type domain-containing protein n=1 Tax=Esox lucius TaxID=8010 RepID=A0AAY5L1Y8_ESOLU